jgi:hypothetical protein
MFRLSFQMLSITKTFFKKSHKNLTHGIPSLSGRENMYLQKFQKHLSVKCLIADKFIFQTHNND